MIWSGQPSVEVPTPNNTFLVPTPPKPMKASILVKTHLIIAEPFQAGEYGEELRVGEKQPS